MIFIALGANLNSFAGPAEKTLHCALCAMPGRGIKIQSVSSFYRTPAWPDPSDPPFVNAVAGIETEHNPLDLMKTLHDIENDFGRIRTKSNGPRTLDLDLLDFDGIVANEGPVLPHPRMSQRAFVLVPLAQIAPHWRHPIGGKPIATLLADLERSDIDAIERLSLPPFAIA